MPEPTLHPNLAKIAAAYDEIIERLGRGMLTPAVAREHIAQLEARDDEGARWSIDPDTGAWVRKTAFGDTEYDTAPPTHGYATADAFDLTPNAAGFNPADRLTHQAVADHAAHPGALLGATRRLAPQPQGHAGIAARVRAVRPRTVALLALTLVVVIAVAIWA